MKNKFLISVVTSIIFSTSAVAKDKTPGSGPNPFADCGIGAALFKDNKTLAVSSNIIWDVGTTAVTSATASPETCNAKTVQVSQFIIESYDNLSEEAARGEGEHLNTLLTIMEVDSSRHAEVIQSIRTEMTENLVSEHFASLDKRAKSAGFYNALVAAI